MNHSAQPDSRFKLPVLASYILVALALLLVLMKGLLSALLAGMLVFALVDMLAPMLGRRISNRGARVIAVAILATVIVALLSLAVWGTVMFFQSDAGSLETLLKKMADILESSRDQMPDWMKEYVPQSADALREMLTAWLRGHAAQAQTVGQEAGRTLLHLLLGMAIGAMAALYDVTTPPNFKPLAAALERRLACLDNAFRRIVFAQLRIAAINAVFTALYLMVVLPLAGVHLPLSKTMVAITFFAGMLPVIGNLISNTVIVIVGLSHSLGVALASLAFLVIIHKLEYFLNAKIIGTHINARAWELLAAMLVMETVFGLPGVIAAPVFYAYMKAELTERGLI